LPPERKPILCYVTDRRALMTARPPAADFSVTSIVPLRSAIQNAVAAGVVWIQIREKDLGGGALADFARLAIADAAETGARIFINDRLDVALAVNAAGVHLGENSLPLAAVAEWRRRTDRRDFPIGVSCHSLEAARAAEHGGADYVFFGPVFATPSKAAFGPPQGIEKLGEVCGSLKTPVLAIGGVTFENARACLEAGAAGIAAVRLFQDAADAKELAARIGAI
jgi:thiamine-phosphate pyrophosphorylase